jgi:hypothetical protein
MDQAGLYAPAHPIGQMTSGELGHYRRVLTEAIETRKSAMVADELRRRLAAVRDEEESRVRIAAAAGTVPADPNAHYYA